MSPNNSTIVRTVTVTVLTLAGMVLFAWLLWKLKIIAVFLAISAVLAIVGRPLTNFLSRLQIGKFQIPRTLGAGLTVLAYYLIFASFVALFSPLIVEQAGILFSIDPADIVSSVEEPLEDLDVLLATLGFEEGALINSAQVGVQNLLGGWVDNISSSFGDLVSFVGNFSVAIFAITFITFFLLKERGLMSRMILGATPDVHMNRVTAVLNSSRIMMRRYLAGIVIQLTAFSLVVAIGLSILGVKYALLIAFFAGLMNVIPYLGPILGGLFGLLIAITTNLEADFYSEMFPLLIKIYLVFAIAQLLDNYIFGPNIFANVVKAHPLEIFLVVIAAAYLGGIIAMIVAIPAYTVLRIIAREFLSEFKVVQSLTGGLNDD